MSKALKVVLLIGLLSCGGCGGWFGWVAYITSRELDAHLGIIRVVNGILGFSYGTPYENGVEVFVIESVASGGIMERAGLREGDYPDCSIGSLYETLVFGRGREVEIPLTRDGKELVIKVAVPQFTLGDDPSELHWYFLKHRESGRPTMRCS